MQETIEINKQDLIIEYDNTSTTGKTLLEKIFGKEVFSSKITDRVKSFEDACKVLGYSESIERETNCTRDEIAYKKLKIIAKALNEGWTPDWNDSSEYKYYPWFYLKNGFVLNGVDYHCTSTYVGSRLCFKSRELAQYAATQFEQLYKEFMVIE